MVLIGDIQYMVPKPGDISAFKAGENCVLAARLESIRLSDIEGDLDGIVGGVTYYGSKTEYEIIINGKPVIVEIYNPQISKTIQPG